MLENLISTEELRHANKNQHYQLELNRFKTLFIYLVISSDVNLIHLSTLHIVKNSVYPKNVFRFACRYSTTLWNSLKHVN